MSAHTPGPWVKDGAVISVLHRGVIARCPTPNSEGVFEYTANARLIALAPRMLETLRAISALSYGYCDEGPSLALEIVREFEEGER